MRAHKSQARLHVYANISACESAADGHDYVFNQLLETQTFTWRQRRLRGKKSTLLEGLFKRDS